MNADFSTRSELKRHYETVRRRLMTGAKPAAVEFPAAPARSPQSTPTGPGLPDLSDPTPWLLVGFLLSIYVRRPFQARDRSYGPRLTAIAETVGGFYGLSRAELVGRRRRTREIWPRHVAIYLARRLTTCSLPEIGQFFNRDHTTCLHAFARVSQRVRDDTMRSAEVEHLVALLKQADRAEDRVP